MNILQFFFKSPSIAEKINIKKNSKNTPAPFVEEELHAIRCPPMTLQNLDDVFTNVRWWAH
jgi:hypothetical protein